MVPQVPENHNLKTNDNLLNDIDIFQPQRLFPHPILITKGYGMLEAGQLIIDDIHIVQIFLWRNLRIKAQMKYICANMKNCDTRMISKKHQKNTTNLQQGI